MKNGCWAAWKECADGDQTAPMTFWTLEGVFPGQGEKEIRPVGFFEIGGRYGFDGVQGDTTAAYVFGALRVGE